MLNAALCGDVETLRVTLDGVNSAVLQAFGERGLPELANHVVMSDVDALLLSPPEGLQRRMNETHHMQLPGNKLTTLLATASCSGQTNVVEMLLKAGAKANGPPGAAQHGVGAPLIQSVSSRATSALECIHALLEAGADADVQIGTGATCLSLLAQQSPESAPGVALRLLIMHGADINLAKASGATPLFSAAQNSNPQGVRLLLHAGADIEKPFRSGATALMIAGGHGASSCVEMLLCARASVHTTASSDGSTALSIASGALDVREKHQQGVENALHILGLLQHELESSAKSAQRLRVGDLTTLVGLRSRAELNRTPARVISAYDEASGRYGVQTLSIADLLELPELGDALGGNERLRVKAENLLERGRALPPPAAGESRLPRITASELVPIAANGQPRVFAALLATRPELAAGSATFTIGERVHTQSFIHIALCLGLHASAAPKVLRAVLSHDASNINMPIQLTPAEEKRHTPLQIVCERGLADLVGVLLEFGALPDAGPRQAPLMYALAGSGASEPPSVRARRAECLRLLLRHRADVHLADECGYEPLLSAAEWGEADGLQLLLEHQARLAPARSPIGREGTGYGPLVAAINNRHSACVRLLLDARADAATTAAWQPLAVDGFPSRSEVEQGARTSYTPMELVEIRLHEAATPHAVKIELERIKTALLQQPLDALLAEARRLGLLTEADAARERSGEATEAQLVAKWSPRVEAAKAQHSQAVSVS